MVDPVEDARREAIILAKLHPSSHITPIEGLCFKDDHLCVVMAQASASLADRLRTPPSLNWRTKIKLLRDIPYGLDFMHACKMIHGDLKPQNILFDEYGNAGLAHVGGTASHKSIALRPMAVTERYTRSSVIKSGRPLTFEDNVYAFGQIIADLAEHYILILLRS